MKQLIRVAKQQWLKLTIGLAVLGFLCSYAVLFWAYETYKSNKLARLKGCSPLAIETQTPSTRSSDILLIGDSRIKAWGNPQLGSNKEVINEGIDGETTTELLCRLDNILNQYKPQLFILQTGINDLVTASMLKEPERERVENRAFGNIQRIIEQLSQSGAKVLYLDIVPPIKPDIMRSIVWGANIEESVQNLNKLIRQNNSNIEQFEMAEVFLNAETNSWRGEYALDALHWTSDAYAHLTQEISRQIQ